MKLDQKISLRRSVMYGAAVVITLYVLMSAAIAFNTVGDCGNEDSPKTWSFFPPEWKCERSAFTVN